MKRLCLRPRTVYLWMSMRTIIQRYKYQSRAHASNGCCQMYQYIAWRSMHLFPFVLPVCNECSTVLVIAQNIPQPFQVLLCGNFLIPVDPIYYSLKWRVHITLVSHYIHFIIYSDGIWKISFIGIIRFMTTFRWMVIKQTSLQIKQ